jgi:rubrerythrin
MTADTRRWLENYQGEVDGAAVYRAMAKKEKDASLAAVYLKLAVTEERHGALWESKLRNAGALPSAPGPSWRARMLTMLTRIGGVSLVASSMSANESRRQYDYDTQADAGVALPQEERSHARVLREIATGGLTGPAIARLEGRHRASAGNALRASVLGVNDGLVSNFGLVMGVAGAGADPRAVLVAGTQM